MKQIDLQLAKLLVTTYNDAQTNMYNDRYYRGYVDGINNFIASIGLGDIEEFENYINKMEEL